MNDGLAAKQAGVMIGGVSCVAHLVKLKLN